MMQQGIEIAHISTTFGTKSSIDDTGQTLTLGGRSDEIFLPMA